MSAAASEPGRSHPSKPTKGEIRERIRALKKAVNTLEWWLDGEKAHADAPKTAAQAVAWSSTISRCAEDVGDLVWTRYRPFPS